MTFLIITILITLHMNYIAINDTTSNINLCNITYMFLSTVISEVTYK